MIRDSIIILAITCVILAFVEFSLRLVFPEKVEEEIDLASLAYKHDPDTIIALKPNITKEFEDNDINGGKTITWKTNSFGYRGEEIGEKEGYRIVVYGDSNVQARFTELDNTFTKKLEQFLAEKINNVEVINAGLVGAGPDQSLLRIKNDVGVIKPDMIVLHIFADNDYGDIIRNRLFELNENNQLIRTSHKLKRDQQISQKEKNFINFLNSLLITRSLKKLITQDESKLSRDDRVNLTIEKLDKESVLEFMNYKKGEEKSTSHFADHYDIDMAINPNGEAATTKKLLMHKVLEKVKAETERNGIRLVIVAQPAVYDVLTDNTIMARKDLSNYEEYTYKNLTDPIKSACSTLELHCIHLIDEFLNNKPETLYRKDDNHWSDDGQELAANITSKYIINNLMLQ